MDHLDWYAMKDPRETPPVFASTEEFLEAVEAKKVDVCSFFSYSYDDAIFTSFNEIFFLGN